MTSQANDAAPFLPLCVDLDHTLLKTDLLYETLILLVKRTPLALAAVPYWLSRSRAFLKHQLALRVRPEIGQLPFRAELVAFLRLEKSKGRRLVLVSAADRTLAETVEDHLHLFDEVIASDGTRNIKGANKAKLLEDRFGKGGFDYVGDSKSDFAVWRSARRALVVTDSRRFANTIKTMVPVEKVFLRSAGRIPS